MMATVAVIVSSLVALAYLGWIYIEDHKKEEQ